MVSKNRIKELRLEKKLTQQNLAQVLHVTRETISNYENNKHNLEVDVLILLAEFFDVTIDYLVGRTDI